MDVTGKIKVFAKQIETKNGIFTAYSGSIGSKNQDGEWDNAYIPIRFRKGVTVEDGTTIDVKNGFLTVQTREDYNRPMLMVMDFERFQGGNSSKDKYTDKSEKHAPRSFEAPTEAYGSGFAAMDEDDVPF